MIVATPKPSIRHIIEPESLLSLTGVRKTTDQFGILLRHYWLPDTVLTYESTVRQGTFPAKSQTITRYQVSCDADSCCWRETISGDSLADLLRFSPNPENSRFCIYNRSEQTFRTQSILGRAAWPENLNEARIQAFLNLPVLTPLLPIPSGFRWHVQADDGFLEFTVDSETFVGDMPVAIIRRHGEFWVNTWLPDRPTNPCRIKILREGIATFATERSVVLEDKTKDIVVEAEESRWLGLETIIDLQLTKSEFLESKATTPLFFQYQTKSGKNYLYDHGTGYIIKISDDIRAVIDDYGKLHPLEIYQKYAELVPEQITEVLSEIERLRRDGYIADHKPDELCHIDKIVYEKQLHDVGDFCCNTGSLLVLGLTERCNLNCAYCCYSGKFAGQRTHSGRSMDIKIAKKAIADFLEQENTNLDNCYSISFYGGEPLLEYPLLTECVEFAKNYSKALGKKVRFAVTTNGTLLDDAVCDFLVENDFLVIISLDGPQQVHDRYRVYPNGKGSFDTVAGHVKRFVERYPDYPKRGLNVTLAPPFEKEATEKFVTEMFLDFPLSRIALANPGTPLYETCSATQYGCHTACAKKTVTLELFQNFSPEDRMMLESLWEECVENLATLGSMEARKRKPLSTYLFEGELETYHRRSVQKNRVPGSHLFVPCMPGFTRRFCDVEGNYRVCERVDDSEAYCLGDVWTGLDPEKLERTLELRRHFGDCANCTSLKTCGLCYARIPGSDAVQEGFDPLFDLTCQTTRKTDKAMFVTYTEIMERNPKAFERPSSSNPPDTKTVRFATQINRLDDAVLMKLCCEKRL